MKPNIKKYIITALTLCLIAGASAGVIGLAHYITAPILESNVDDETTKLLQKVFGDNATFSSETKIDNQTYLTSYWTAKVSGNEVGDAFKTSGSNSYGSISMIVGIKIDGSVGKIYLITNTESYAVYVNQYVAEYNDGTRALDDVQCGATKGATLVKNMAVAAQDFYKNRKGLQ